MTVHTCLNIGGVIAALIGAAMPCVGAESLSAASADTTAAQIVVIDTMKHPEIFLPSAVRDTSSSAIGTMHFFRQLGQAFFLQAASPFRMNEKQAVTVAAGIGITAGIIAFDEEIDRAIRPLRGTSMVIRENSSRLTEFGGTNGIIAAAAFAGYSVLWNDEKAQQTSLLLAEALITSGVWARLGKLLAGRERPSAAYEYSHQPGGQWHGLGGILRKKRGETIAKYDAFPSGHTTTAFAIATVFAKRYRESSYVPAISYSLATIVGLTRMIEHTHWASDVFAGACLGYLCADQVVAQFDEQAAGMPAAEASNRTAIRLSIGFLNDAPAVQCAVAF